MITNKVLAYVEMTALCVVFILGLLWMINPLSVYKSCIVVVLLIGTSITDLIRRKIRNQNKLDPSQILLYAEWESLSIAECSSISGGSTLEGFIEPGNKIRLGLQNKNEIALENISIAISGNANCEAHHSSSFLGNENRVSSRLLNTVCSSKHGIILRKFPKGSSSENEGLNLTKLWIGNVSWGNRNSGILYVRLTVNGDGLMKPTEFVIALISHVIDESGKFVKNL